MNGAFRPATLWLQPVRCTVLVALLLGSPLFSGPQFQRREDSLERVIELIDRRLALMPEVAAAKWRRQQPVTDATRERRVLEQSVAEAIAINVDAEAAGSLFATQILMARAVQEALFREWREHRSEPPVARDLATEIRPELDAIGRELIPALYLASAAMVEAGEPALRTRLARLRRHHGVSDEPLEQLVAAFRGMRITGAASWETVHRVGFLRVGTTGDYAPFSHEAGDGLRGLDIELAQALAKAWGVDAIFVPTTWGTLKADLLAHRFDVAASGISVTAERAAWAGFSQPYHFDGKTPIARRGDAARFSSLEEIDRPGIRIVVNPGGTNERFVREHIRHGTIVVHPDNRTIFEEIVAGRADVMITDGIEVRLQVRRHPELAAAGAKPFTWTGKAILLPLNSELTARVDAWLAPQLADGRLAAQLERALAEAR